MDNVSSVKEGDSREHLCDSFGCGLDESLRGNVKCEKGLKQNETTWYNKTTALVLELHH